MCRKGANYFYLDVRYMDNLCDFYSAQGLRITLEKDEIWKKVCKLL